MPHHTNNTYDHPNPNDCRTYTNNTHADPNPDNGMTVACVDVYYFIIDCDHLADVP